VNVKGARGGPLRQAAAGLLIVLALGGCTPGGTVNSGSRPRIAITSYFPLTIEGRQFRPGEKVVLRAQPSQAKLNPAYFFGRVRSDGTFI